MKKWEQLQSTLNNSKFEEGRGDYLDNTQICSRQEEFDFLNVIFYRFCLEHFARSNRVSQNPAILLKNKARQSKTKTRFSYDG